MCYPNFADVVYSRHYVLLSVQELRSIMLGGVMGYRQFCFKSVDQIHDCVPFKLHNRKILSKTLKFSTFRQIAQI